MENHRLPDAEKIAALVAFLPTFRAPGFAPLRPAEGPGHWPVYEPAVTAFFALAGRPVWCDHGYDPKDAGAKLRDPAYVATAGLAELAGTGPR